ncbi:MAG: hypothetical protein KF758_02020 [Anaerolineales bacterium]|nr:hypothetical protein [Anaerolineales bacterium]MBX3035665.1 hypothetical protein [Anaerolineales bacterium]
MDIIIEVGTDEQKHLIKQELQYAFEILPKDFIQSIQLEKIIVPIDFQFEINKLENTKTYKSLRGLGANIINVLGRIVEVENGYVIVLSPSLYTETQDSQTRLLTVFHELHHLVNKKSFPKIINTSFVSGMYLENMYRLYDEYSSDYFAFRMLDTYFPSKTELWEKQISSNMNGLLELITDKSYYEHIKQEIESFRIHANVDLFLNRIKKHIDEMGITLAHTFSLAHFYPDKISRENLLKSNFVNGKTFAIMEFFREKQSQNETDLKDGLHLIIAFFENFGVRFEDIDNDNYYCKVLDI